MAIPPGGKTRSLSYLRFFLTQQQRNLHAFAEEGKISAKTHRQVIADVIGAKPRVRADMNKWKKLDSRKMGIQYGVIPSGAWTVMKILRSQGFDAYLVGGCVRDLLLKKTPKDFDVITNASLNEIKKKFHRAEIVGRRFPICVVHLRDSVTEVSSFETVAKHAEGKKEIRFSQAPHGCQLKDFTLWRNSLKRDFTINSLFLDPFSNRVYDYSSGITDLRFLILRTIIPAKVSFEEDCARILRGLRIAARLGLSFSKDTEDALHKLSPSITKLAKARLLMEVNYMLSYGAAEPSLCLLRKFNLLEILLPLQEVYLAQQQSTETSQNSTMLMKLFSNLDKVVSCDHPSDCRLWVGILAFHLTLVNNPQDAFVVLTLASILYHGEWKEGLRYARENADVQVNFKPELSGTFASKSDEELADEVSQLAAFVQDTVAILTDEDILLDSMSSYPTSSSSGLVFTPRGIGQDVAELFQMLVKRSPSNEKRRENFDIHFQSLGKGHLWETRFVLGKIILETMGCKTWQRDAENLEENNMLSKVSEENIENKLSNHLKRHVEVKEVRENGVREDASEAKPKSDNRLKSKVGLFEVEMLVEKEDKTNELAEEDEFTLLLGDILEKSTKTNQSSPDTVKEKKGDTKKRKRKSKKSKDETPPKLESPDRETTEQEKGENVKNKKKQRRRRDENNPLETGSELLGGKSTEKKNGNVKKTKPKSKSEKPIIETATELPDGEVVDEKKRGGEKQQIESKSTTASKKHGVLQERNSEVNGGEHKLVVEKENKTLSLLSSLFS